MNMWQGAVKKGLMYIDTTKGQTMFVGLMKTELAVGLYYDYGLNAMVEVLV